MSHFIPYRTVSLSAPEERADRMLSRTERAGLFFSRHILLAWLVCFVGMPLTVLAGVALFACAAVLPLALLMGW